MKRRESARIKCERIIAKRQLKSAYAWHSARYWRKAEKTIRKYRNRDWYNSIPF